MKKTQFEKCHRPLLLLSETRCSIPLMQRPTDKETQPKVVSKGELKVESAFWFYRSIRVGMSLVFLSLQKSKQTTKEKTLKPIILIKLEILEKLQNSLAKETI